MTIHEESRFCAELYDYILDFLHDDEAALRACALVCREWLPTSRVHLFDRLVLTGSPATATNSWAPNTPSRRLFAALRASPHLAPYVNKLSVQESAVSRPSTYRWASAEITFPPLLKKLGALRELEFSFPAPGPSDVKTIWSTMVFKDISDAMSSSTLESLTIRHFSFSTLTDFVKILNSCRHLTTLQFDNVDISTATNLSTSALEHVLNIQHSNTTLAPATEQKAPLNNLVLRSSSLSLFIPILLHASSPLDLSGLRSLIINITPDNYPNVLELLLHTQELESLELEIDPSFDYATHLEGKDVIDLHLLPSLTTLSLQVSLLLARTDPLPWLYALLSSARPDNRLASLSLSCVIDKPPPSITIRQFDEVLAGWRDLGDLLSQSAFDPLKRFKLNLALDSPVGNDTVEQISADFVEQLSSLAKKGVLEVDVCEVR